MRVFIRQAYILATKEKRLEWDPKAHTGTFMGYEEAFEVYRVLVISTGK